MVLAQLKESLVLGKNSPVSVVEKSIKNTTKILESISLKINSEGQVNDFERNH